MFVLYNDWKYISTVILEESATTWKDLNGFKHIFTKAWYSQQCGFPSTNRFPSNWNGLWNDAKISVIASIPLINLLFCIFIIATWWDLIAKYKQNHIIFFLLATF